MKMLLRLKVTVEVSSFSKASPRQNKSIKAKHDGERFLRNFNFYDFHELHVEERIDFHYIATLSDIPKIKRGWVCYIGIMFLLFSPYFAQTKKQRWETWNSSEIIFVFWASP